MQYGRMRGPLPPLLPRSAIRFKLQLARIAQRKLQPVRRKRRWHRAPHRVIDLENELELQGCD